MGAGLVGLRGAAAARLHRIEAGQTVGLVESLALDRRGPFLLSARTREPTRVEGVQGVVGRSGSHRILRLVVYES